MFQHIDNFLIDRVFQSISDKLARWVSCYGIAAFLFSGCAVGTTTCMLLSIVKIVSVIAYAIPLPLFVMMAKNSHEADAKPPTNVLPIYRIAGIFGRMLFLFFLIPFNISNVVLLDNTIVQEINATDWIVYTIGLYFMACRKLPPQYATKPLYEGAA